MISRSTDTFFWPALIGSWGAAVVGLLAALLPRPFDPLVFPSAVLLGGLAMAMFLTALFDAPTRKAVEAFNQHLQDRWRELSWCGRLFSPSYGDLRLLIINRLVCLEIAAFILTGNQDQGFALLAFISFALSTLMLMLMLMMKHQSGKGMPKGS